MPSLIGIALVKNECDIIELVRYNLRILDGLVILDHESSDNTRAILERLQDEGLPIAVLSADEGAAATGQRTNLLLEVRATRRPKLVVPLDADSSSGSSTGPPSSPRSPACPRRDGAAAGLDDLLPEWRANDRPSSTRCGGSVIAASPSRFPYWKGGDARQGSRMTSASAQRGHHGSSIRSAGAGPGGRSRASRSPISRCGRPTRSAPSCASAGWRAG